MRRTQSQCRRPRASREFAAQRAGTRRTHLQPHARRADLAQPACRPARTVWCRGMAGHTTSDVNCNPRWCFSPAHAPQPTTGATAASGCTGAAVVQRPAHTHPNTHHKRCQHVQTSSTSNARQQIASLTNCCPLMQGNGAYACPTTVSADRPCMLTAHNN